MECHLPLIWTPSVSLKKEPRSVKTESKNIALGFSKKKKVGRTIILIIILKTIIMVRRSKIVAQ